MCVGRIRLRQHWVSFVKAGYSVAPLNSFGVDPEIKTLDGKGVEWRASGIVATGARVVQESQLA